jgi:NitT/TauT family transport system permease protein
VSARPRLFLYRALFGLALLGFWEVASGRLIDPFWVSSPSRVFGYLAQVTLDGSIFEHAAVTLYEAVTGFVIGAISGVSFGFLLARRETVASVLDPYIVAFNGIPRIALAPLFIIWFGFGLVPKVFMTFLLSFFPIVIDAVVGFRSLDPEIVYLTRSMGLSGWQAFLKVRLPHALPQIFAGLKVAITLATAGAIIGEWVGADRGLGYLLLVAGGDLRTSLLFATLVVLTAIGLVLYYLMVLAERLAIPWHVSRRGPLGAEGGL